MNKLQEYYNYFEKHSFDDLQWVVDWCENLKKWSEIAQIIKKKVKNTDFSNSHTQEQLDILNRIIRQCSNRHLNSVNDFLERYLYKSDNGISVVRQQLLTHTTRDRITNNVNQNPQLLIDILEGDDIRGVDQQIRKLTADTNERHTVVCRFLRVLFPSKMSSPDAPNHLHKRIAIIQSKLNIQFEGDIINKHQQLMNSVQSNNIYKKQIFFWMINNMLLSDLNLKKAIVYYGAPGTGKTWKAQKIARRFIDEFRIKLNQSDKTNYSIKTVQFHPSYAYEDFMEGIRPTKDGKLELANGAFKLFCKENGAKEINLYQSDDFLTNEDFKQRNYDFSRIFVNELTTHQKSVLEIPENVGEGLTIQEVIEPAFFIIDEINRADLSKVLGELMYSLEYRGYNGKIKTQYSYLNTDENDKSIFFWEEEDWFFIPQNIFLIGTMNNIDRSVDSFDFALRRRFSWEKVSPDFNIVRRLLKANWTDKLAQSFENLNKAIKEEELLGEDYQIGHSYALQVQHIEYHFEKLDDIKNKLWNEFIAPLIEEYLRGLGSQSIAQEKLNHFKKQFGL